MCRDYESFMTFQNYVQLVHCIKCSNWCLLWTWVNSRWCKWQREL